MKNKTIIFILVILVVLMIHVIPSSCYAARKRVRKATQQPVYVPQGVEAYVRFRADRRGLLINFSNFSNLQSGSYELLYETNGVTQGAGGSIILGDSSTKEVLFGTCSGGVCNWHENITNARLSIYSTLKDGTKVLKPFRIRV